MAVPARHGTPVMSSSATITALTTGALTAGDLIVVYVASAADFDLDFTPTNCVLESTTLHSATAGHCDAKLLANGLGAYILSVKVLSTSGAATCTVTTFPTGTSGTQRRFALQVMSPGAGRAFDVRSSRVRASASGTDGSSAFLQLSAWSPPLIPGAIAGIVFRSSGLGTPWDWDLQGDGAGTTFETTSAAGLGGGRSTTGGNVSIADGYVAAGLTPHNGVMVHGSQTKTGVAVFYESAVIVAIGMVHETETVNPFTRAKRKSIGMVAEHDFVWSQILPPGHYAIFIASETDTALPLHVSKAKTIGMVTETEKAFALRPGLGAALEHETVFPLSLMKGWPGEWLLSPVDATQIPQSLRVWAWKLNGTDAGDMRITLKEGSSIIQQGAFVPLTTTPKMYALPISNSISDRSNLRAHLDFRTTGALTAKMSDIELTTSYAINMVTEIETVFPAFHGTVYFLGMVHETETVFHLVHQVAHLLGRVTETETVFPVGRKKGRAIQMVLEGDTVLSVQSAAKPTWVVGEIPIA